MRLGKEQAVGYVEDTEADVAPERQQADTAAPAQAADPALRVG